MTMEAVQPRKDVFLSGREVANIQRDLRLIQSVLQSGIVMHRARQLADVAGDPTRSNHPDDRSGGGGEDAHDPSDRIRRFIGSKQRGIDADALRALERGVHNAVTSLRGAITGSDRAISGRGKVLGDNAEQCEGCGKMTILINGVHCLHCDAEYRRSRTP